MILRKLVFVAVALCASISQAGRTALTDLGLSVYVPSGWTLSYLSSTASDTESTRTYLMLNEANPDRAAFTFEVMDRVSSLGARSWTTLTGYAESLNIQGYPYSVVYIDDSVVHDGLFAWRVYGRYGEFDAQNLPAGVVDRYSRSFAYGDVGWTIAFEGDTADVDTAGPTYTKILDSVKVDRSFQSLPLRTQDRSIGLGFTPSRFIGGALAIAGAARPVVRASDAMGRAVEGDLAIAAEGWVWTPRTFRPGLVLVRIQSSGRDESLRAVLKP